MELFCNDWMLGDFQASDYGLIVASFSSGSSSEDETGIGISIQEQFIGNHPIPVYIGQEYNNKLKPQITLVKNPCMHDEVYFTENDCRAVLRKVVGYNGYQWMRLINDNPDENLWYKAKVVNVSYQRMGSKVAGILLEMECDSCFAWSKEYIVTMNAKANQTFTIYNNTDDLYHYVFPVTTVSPTVAGEISITNHTENWETRIANVSASEILTMDSKNELLSSGKAHASLLNDFNLHYIRFVPGRNEFIVNQDAVIQFQYRVPRKAGFVG